MMIYSMGLGKTLMTLDALTVDMLPALIVAPLRVARYVWPEEISEFGFPWEHCLLHRDSRPRLWEKSPQIKIANFESLKYIFDSCTERGFVPFRTIIADESSAFKNPGSKRWKYMRALTELVDNVVLLTGTPGVHHDLYGQLSLIKPDLFGSYSEFCTRFFDFDIYGRPVIKGPAEEAAIEAIARPYVLHHGLDQLDMPEINRQVVTFDLPPDRLAEYNEIEVLEDDTFAALRTFASGFRYRYDADGRQLVQWMHDAKLDVLGELLTEADEPTLIVTNYRAERSMIVNRFGFPYIDGESKEADEAKAFDDWNAGRLKGLVIHPASVGHGLRLEKGGRRMIFYSLPLSQELFDQTIARLYRSGQKQSVFVSVLCAADTIEEALVELIKRKCLSAANLLIALKGSGSLQRPG